LDGHGAALDDDSTPYVRAARGETFRMRFCFEDESGERRWFEASGEPIRSSQSDQQGGVVVFREVGER
jgi:hypothetical protein